MENAETSDAAARDDVSKRIAREQRSEERMRYSHKKTSERGLGWKCQIERRNRRQPLLIENWNPGHYMVFCKNHSALNGVAGGRAPCPIWTSQRRWGLWVFTRYWWLFSQSQDWCLTSLSIAKTLASLDVAAFAIWPSELVRMAHCSRK